MARKQEIPRGSLKKRIESSARSLIWLEENEPGLWVQKYLKIQDKSGRLIPFRFNSTQRMIYREIRDCWMKRIPVRIEIPKARQVGTTTLIEALNFERVFRYRNRNCGVVAHLDDSAENIFQMTHRFHVNLPEAMHRPQKYSSKREIHFDSPHDSRFAVGTIRSGDALGKSYTFQYFHGSEVANWSDRGNDAINAWVSVAQTIPRHWDTMVFMESTGKGRDPFFYRRIERHLRPSYTGIWRVLFIPWYLADEYSLPATHAWTPTEGEKALRDSVFDKTGMSLSDEQLEWRRRAIEDECEGSFDLFRRYYPTALEDCFETTERAFFSMSVRDHYREQVRPALVVGDLVQAVSSDVKDIDLHPNESGLLRVWRPPIPGESYSIFCDPNENGVDPDGNAIYVMWHRAIEVVAAVHQMAWDTDEMARFLVRLGYFYNTAKLAAENNRRPDLMRLVWREHRYPNIYWRSDPATTTKRAHKPGWTTNESTRSTMLDALRNVTRRHDLKVYDEGFVEEMEAFVLNEEKGKYMAAPGENDDRIMAMAGLVVVSRVDIRLAESAKRVVEKTVAEKRDEWHRKMRSNRVDTKTRPKKKRGVIIG